MDVIIEKWGVLFRRRELTEFCGKLGEFCEKLGEFAFAHK